jgi:hypothetical protein
VRALIDTDVLLDVALEREPFFRDAAKVIRWAQDEPGQIAIAWHSFSNVAYLVHPARGFISDLLNSSRLRPPEAAKQNRLWVFQWRIWKTRCRPQPPSHSMPCTSSLEA